jgi:hypothetical protein
VRNQNGRERSRKIEALLEEERRNQGPPKEVRAWVSERVEATLGVEISKAQLLEHPMVRSSHPPLRLVPKGAKPALASLLAFAPMALASLGAAGVASGIAYVSMPHQMKERLRRAIHLPGNDFDGSSPVLRLPFGMRPGESSSDPNTIAPVTQGAPVASDRSLSLAANPAVSETAAGNATKRRKVGSQDGPLAPAIALPGSGRDVLLAEESALLEQARIDLLRGSGARALQTLATHQRRFPAGRMLEQREALTIQALVLAGRRNEAHLRAERFRDRYPGSLMLQVIRSALDSEDP